MADEDNKKSDSVMPEEAGSKRVKKSGANGKKQPQTKPASRKPRKRKSVRSPSTLEPVEQAPKPVSEPIEEAVPVITVPSYTDYEEPVSPPRIGEQAGFIPPQEEEISPQPKDEESSWDDLAQGFSPSEPAPEGKTEETRKESKEALTIPKQPIEEEKYEESIPPPEQETYFTSESRSKAAGQPAEIEEKPKQEEKILPEERFSAFPEEISDADEEELKDKGKFLGEVKHSLSSVFGGKKLIGCCIVLIVLAAGGLFLFYGGTDFISKLIEKQEQARPEKEENAAEQISQQADFIKSAIDIAYKVGESYAPSTGALTSSLQLAYEIGASIPAQPAVSTGLDEAFETGFTGHAFDDNAFKKYVRVFSELKNAYSTDIYGILNNSTNRAVVLNTQLSIMEDTYKRASEQAQAIEKEMNQLKSDFKNIKEPKNEAEKNFFENLKEGMPNESFDALGGYILLAQKQSEVKARHNALATLLDYYKIILKKMGLRIEDIKKNRDALIEGVRVYEVPGSNVDVIIKSEKKKAEQIDALESPIKTDAIIPPDAGFNVPQIKYPAY